MFRLFDIDIRKLLLVIFVLALPILSVNLQRGPDEPAFYARPLAFVGGFIQGGYTGFSEGIRNTVGLYMNLIDTKVDNRGLQKENSELRATLMELNELKAENTRLNRLLDFQQKSGMRLMAARVTGFDLMAEHSTIRIGRGSIHGVKKGQAVITADGVVGYVFDVSLNSSRVLVLTDRYAVIDAIVERSRARGIVEGISPDSCHLKYLHRTDDVKPGDLIVASGIDSIFPKGFPIGKVSLVEAKKYGVTQRVELVPIVDPTRLEEIFVVFKVEPEAALETAVVPAKGTHK